MSNYAKYGSIGNKPEPTEPVFPVHEIADMNDKQTIIKHNPIVCIYIHGTWCGPCKTVAPQFAELCRNYNKPGFVFLCKEKVDDGLSAEVTGVPAFHFYLRGERVHITTGADIEEIEKICNVLINKFKSDNQQPNRSRN